MNIIEKTYSLNGSLQTRAKTDMIILHHAVYNGDVEGIDRIHKGKGWTCIGYHFYVRKDGSIYRGRKENAVGAHAYGSNMTSIGICAEGNFETDVMSDAQKNAIIELVNYLKGKYGISKVIRHKDVNATACPGKNYPFNEIVNAKVTKPVENTTKVDNGYLVKITTDVLRIRKGAGIDTEQVGAVKRGEVYTIVETKGNWGKLKSGAGWICLDYTTKTNSTSNETKKSIDELAKEVIAGKWGNGADRKTKLTNAGYDYNAIQKRVNQILA